MNFSELCAAYTKHQKEFAAISNQKPSLQRIGPATHGDHSCKMRIKVAQVETDGVPGLVAIGPINEDMGTELTTAQCEWLRDVLMEWFPKEDMSATSCLMCRDRDALRCPDDIRAALFGVAEQAGKGNWFNALARVQNVLKLCVAGLRSVTTYRPDTAGSDNT